MKKIILIIALIGLLTCCSQISTEDYNKVIKENENLKNQIKNIQEENKEISDILDKILKDLENQSSASSENTNKDLNLDELFETSSTDMAKMLSDLSNLISNSNLSTENSAHDSMNKIKVFALESSRKMSNYLNNFEEINDSQKKLDLYIDYVQLLNTVYNMFFNLNTNLENVSLEEYSVVISKATTEMNRITDLTNDIVDRYF